MEALIGSKINNQNSLMEESNSDNKDGIQPPNIMGSENQYSEVCPECWGSGSKADNVCSSCNGKGVI